MKKLFIVCCVVLSLFVGQFAFAECRSTYELVADTQVFAKRGSLCGITIITDGTNAARVILYDVADVGDIAVTNKIAEITVKGVDNYGGRIWDSGNNVQFTEGVYADVNGTGASYIIEWK